MRKWVWIVILLLLTTAVGCGSASQEERLDASPPVDPTAPAAVEVEAEPTAAPTAVPSPTSEPSPEPTPEPTSVTLITEASDLAGVWLGTVAGEQGYVLYTADGTYAVALTVDNLVDNPRVTGEFWFDDGHIHMRDLENVGHWADCPAETVGVYDVVPLDEGKVQFQTVEDLCNTGGFTRNYLFSNMSQEWLSAPPPSPENAYPELAEALQGIADTWVADNGVPSFILLVDAPDMGFTWKGAAGMADPESNLPAVADDQFIISSGTKMVTGVTILKLAEEGRLALDDPISTYLPAELVEQLLVIDGEAYGAEITVRQLLNHTSGLGDFSNGADNDGNGLPDWKDVVLNDPDKIWDEEMVLEWAIANAPPAGKPGEQFAYSDTNYQLLGLIIEETSGLALHEAYRQLIFEPLGMTHTYFEFREPPLPGVDGRSLSHMLYAGQEWTALDSRSYEWGSGGLVSTVEDQNRFLRSWVNGDLFADPATKDEMTSWVETPDAGAYYGLGVWHFVLDEWDIPGLGSLDGHAGLPNSYFYYWPEQNITLVGTLNSNEPAFGFISVMLEVMGTVMAHSGG